MQATAELFLICDRCFAWDLFRNFSKRIIVPNSGIVRLLIVFGKFSFVLLNDILTVQESTTDWWLVPYHIVEYIIIDVFFIIQQSVITQSALSTLQHVFIEGV